MKPANDHYEEDEAGLEAWYEEDEDVTATLHDCIWFDVLWSTQPAPIPSLTRLPLKMDAGHPEPMNEAQYAAMVVYCLKYAGSSQAFPLIRNLRSELSAYRDRGFEPEDVARDILTKYPDFGGRSVDS